jgi:hypothetical protein
LETVHKQYDLFPTNEPEIRGQITAFAVVLRGLIEALIANGQITPQQVSTIIHHADLKTTFAIWDQLQGKCQMRNCAEWKNRPKNSSNCLNPRIGQNFGQNDF